MRGKHDSSSVVSEVASAELLCYGVFRKLEQDDNDGGGGGVGGGGDDDDDDDRGCVDGGCGGGGGGSNRVIAGRPPRSPVPPPIAFSPHEPSTGYVVVTDAAAATDDDRHRHYHCDIDFERDTTTSYSAYSDCCCGTATATTTTADNRSYLDDDGGGRLNDFGVWHDDRRRYDYPAVAITGELRGAAAGGAAGAPFSHTPMGSTTKLVGIDANSDDSPKVSVARPILS